MVHELLKTLLKMFKLHNKPRNGNENSVTLSLCQRLLIAYELGWVAEDGLVVLAQGLRLIFPVDG